MKYNLQKLSDDWKSLEDIVLYGAGAVSNICIDLFDKVNVHILCVIDQDLKKQGEKWNGISIISFEEAEKIIRNKKIVVMTAHTAYKEISCFLRNKGFKEYEDYCGIGQFICEWFWYAKQINCIYHVDMTITTRCTFKCRKCNMFIPFYKNQRDCSFEELKKNVDLLFKRLDYVVYFGLIGGETMLSPSLIDILSYIGENYREKYGRISFTTNGSIIPSDELCYILKKYNIHLLISDYTKEISYQNRFNDTIKKVERCGIVHDIRHDIEWCDFGFPESPIHRNEEQLKEHLQCCHPEWNGLNDGKFYYCNISWSAEKSGYFKLKEEDYILLETIDDKDKEACHRIVELSRGSSSFCKICGGCGSDNRNYVTVAEQWQEKG